MFMTRNPDEPGTPERSRWDFPAGELKPADSLWIPMAGWNASRCARALRKENESRSQAYFVAAGRIAFERTGLILAQTSEGTAATCDDVALAMDSREAMFRDSVSFSDVLVARDLEFRPDMLRPWLRWINTEWQFKRHDTVFFATVVPPEQQVDFRSFTGAWGGWVNPGEFLEMCGENSSDYISGPVRLICESLVGVSSAVAAMCKIRDITPITPEVFKRDGRWWVSLDPKADPSERGRVRATEVVDSTNVDEDDTGPTSLTSTHDSAVALASDSQGMATGETDP